MGTSNGSVLGTTKVVDNGPDEASGPWSSIGSVGTIRPSATRSGGSTCRMAGPTSWSVPDLPGQRSLVAVIIRELGPPVGRSSGRRAGRPPSGRSPVARARGRPSSILGSFRGRDSNATRPPTPGRLPPWVGRLRSARSSEPAACAMRGLRPVDPQSSDMGRNSLHSSDCMVQKAQKVIRQALYGSRRSNLVGGEGLNPRPPACQPVAGRWASSRRPSRSAPATSSLRRCSAATARQGSSRRPSATTVPIMATVPSCVPSLLETGPSSQGSEQQRHTSSARHPCPASLHPPPRGDHLSLAPAASRPRYVDDPAPGCSVELNHSDPLRTMSLNSSRPP